MTVHRTGNRAYKRLWLAVGVLLANAEDPKFVKTKTAMCGAAELEKLGKVWANSPLPKLTKKAVRT